MRPAIVGSTSPRAFVPDRPAAVMQVTLIHNPGAGKGGDVDSPASIEASIRAAGHDVHAQSADAPDWADALDRPAELVAVLGGDGTVGRVARRMIGRRVPIAALAAGTANNIAMTLGTEHMELRRQIAGWSGGRRLPFDVCVARGPWGTEHLLEGLGCGLFTWGMRNVDDAPGPEPATPGERIARVLAMLDEQVGAHPPTRIDATLDGNDVSGDYVLLEAMNTRFVGPNLFLAPDGHPADGLLDVITVREDERDAFREHLASWKRGALRPPDWPARRGRHLTLQWTGFPLHLDDRLWPDAQVPRGDGGTIELEVEQGALEFLVPQDTEHPPVA
jgi:diacylglycerol kinase (ATP)